jgi:hypothetical protein
MALHLDSTLKFNIIVHDGQKILSNFTKLYQILPKGFFGQRAIPCASPPPRPSIYSDYSFLVQHPV